MASRVGGRPHYRTEHRAGVADCTSMQHYGGVKYGYSLTLGMTIG